MLLFWDGHGPGRLIMLDAQTATASSNPHVAALARAYRAWAETGGGNVDEVVDLMDDDIVMDSVAPPEVPHALSGTHSRKDGARAYFTALLDEWTMIAWEVDRFLVDEDGDDVVMIGRCRWRHKQSGSEVGSPKVDIWHFEGGKATRFFELFDTLAFAQGLGLVQFVPGAADT